ncbi:MAG: hypothetical protein GX374_02250 [Bacilli bacterium]|nr:hypothetical protein [Bacilli bacterium]
MKYVKKFWNHLYHPTPNEPIPFIIMQSNREIIIEHVDELLSFSDQMISLYCQSGTVEVHGKQLAILLMKKSELVISGHIMAIKFYPGERRKR